MTDEEWQLLPALSDEEFAALKSDIAERGVLVAIELDDAGAILDGHHRLRAWTELRAEGMKIPDYPRVVRSGLSDIDKRQLVRALNIARRHLSAEDRRALIAGAIRDDPTASDRRIAVAIGVSHPTVAAVRSELEVAGVVESLSTRTDTLGRTQPARRPSIVVGSARDEARARAALIELGDDAPQKMINLKAAEERARDARLSKLRASSVPPVIEGPAFQLRLGDLREVWADIPDQSIDAIVTDPPYNNDGMVLYKDLAQLAVRVLKPGRLAAIYCGELHLSELIELLNAGGLSYVWHGVNVQPGTRARIGARMVNGQHRSVLLYSGGEFMPRKWINDTCWSEGAGGPSTRPLHQWQQAVGPMRHWVQMTSKPGETVLDPFLGSGTTAIAAVSEGRCFLGGDIDPACVETTRLRLAEMESTESEGA